ncbi:MAG TPA: acyltransferase [Bacteroidia bacterium]|nr:acyltransferase [Bacteroidia bacterium]
MSEEKPITYFENLDCLRAIAALMVIFTHIGSWLKFPDTPFYSKLEQCLTLNDYGGRFGVYLFFVISGFLITYLMLLERGATNTFNVKNFYIRRVLRIWPLYFMVLLVGFAIYPFLINKCLHQSYVEKASLLMYSIFLTNYDNIRYITPNGILGVQWSVAVEEQFYLIWPIIFIFFGKKKFPLTLIAITIFSEIFYMMHLNQFRRQFFDTLGIMRYLSFGALLAWACYTKPDAIKSFFDKIHPVLMAAIYLAAAISPFVIKLLAGDSGANNFLNSIIPMIFFGFIIVEQNYSRRSFYKFGKIKTLNWLGKISYGLYLTHMIAIYIVNFLFSGAYLYKYMAFQIVLVLVFTIIISYISYTYVEKYFLTLKDKFKYIK